MDGQGDRGRTFRIPVTKNTKEEKKEAHAPAGNVEQIKKLPQKSPLPE